MSVEAVEEKVKTAVFKKGLRIAEFSRDYDKRRSGFITTTQFHRTVRSVPPCCAPHPQRPQRGDEANAIDACTYIHGASRRLSLTSLLLPAAAGCPLSLSLCVCVFPAAALHPHATEPTDRRLHLHRRSLSPSLPPSLPHLTPSTRDRRLPSLSACLSTCVSVFVSVPCCLASAGFAHGERNGSSRTADAACCSGARSTQER